MIFTTFCGSQSIRIVLNSTLVVKITIMEIIDNTIPMMPDISEPVRRE